MLVGFFHRAGRAAIVLATLTLVVAPIRGDAQAPASQSHAVVPVVISGKLPQVMPIAVQAKIQAIVRVRVTTDGEKVTAADVLRQVPMFNEPVLDAIKSWRFAPHTPTTFETSVTYSFRYPEPQCYNRDQNTHWSLVLPLKIDVNPVGDVLCHDSPVNVGAVRTLRGRIRCDCPGGPAVAGAEITARPYRDSGRTIQVRTSKDGEFAFPAVPPGEYLLDIDAPRFFERSWLVRVTPADERSQLDLTLEIDNKTVPPPPADATAGEVPTYPESARLAGIEGVVRLRVAVDRTVTVLGGPPELASAALADIRTWTFHAGPREPMDVGYRYALMPGDCSGNQNPHVSMKLPLEVEVLVKRRVECGGAAQSTVPRVVDTDIPEQPPIFGNLRITDDVRLRVTTDGSVVRDVEVVSDARNVANQLRPLTESAATALVRSWRFAPHTPTTFESVVRYLTLDGADCESRSSSGDIRFVGRLPADVTLINSPVYLCHWPEQPNVSTRPFEPVRWVRGTLRCDCFGTAPLAGVRLSAYIPKDRPYAVWADTTTDEAGRFAFEPLPPGRYRVAVHEAGFLDREFEVDVSTSAGGGSLALSVSPDPAYRPYAPLSPWLRSGKIPGYPEELRRAGIEGTVRLAVHEDGTVRVLSGQGPLAAAAIENAKTIQLSRDPRAMSAEAEMEYRYRLVAGDCSNDQNPIVIRRWHAFEIIAKKPMSCGAASRRLAFKPLNQSVNFSIRQSVNTGH